MNCQFIQEETQYLRNELKNHKVYTAMSSMEGIRSFMEAHVFAVWDFMSLVKSLQRHFTTVDVPWVPKSNPKLARFINEIVLGEESDVNELGEYKSHFVMYLEAMKQIGADTSNIQHFLTQLNDTKSINQAIDSIDCDERIKGFVRFTFEVIHSNQPHLIASVFTFGREDIIPELFLSILQSSDVDHAQYSKLRYYLDRHIEVDGDEHGPLSLLMVSELCGQDNQKWMEAIQVAKDALEHRILLWDAIHEQILVSNSVN
jgi:hypothetical protein